MHISHGGIHYAACEEPDGVIAIVSRISRRPQLALAERNGWQVELFRHKAQALSNCPYSHSTPQQPAMRQQFVADTQP